MPFIIQCDNKGCFKQTEALIDKDSNDVFCSDCGEIIKNVTHFTKVQLKSMGQTTKKKKTNSAFQVNCPSCNDTDTPVLRDKKVFCKKCNEEINNLSAPFVQMLSLNIKNGN